MNWFPVSLSAALASLALTAAPAVAQPRLLSSHPTPRAVVTKPTRVALTFNEQLVSTLSSIELVMTGMPGMTRHAPMKMTGYETSVSKDGKTLIAQFPRALPVGNYALTWAAASKDDRIAKGALVFSAK